MRKGDVNWFGFGKELLWHMIVCRKNEDSGYDMITEGACAGEIGRWRLSSAVHPSICRGLTWKELALELGLFRKYLTRDGHDCAECPERDKCTAFFKDDRDHEVCGRWMDMNGVPVPEDEPYENVSEAARMCIVEKGKEAKDGEE